jgi:hypothetical protein
LREEIVAEYQRGMRGEKSFIRARVKLFTSLKWRAIEGVAVMLRSDFKSTVTEYAA